MIRQKKVPFPINNVGMGIGIMLVDFSGINGNQGQMAFNRTRSFKWWVSRLIGFPFRSL